MKYTANKKLKSSNKTYSQITEETKKANNRTTFGYAKIFRRKYGK